MTPSLPPPWKRKGEEQEPDSLGKEKEQKLFSLLFFEGRLFAFSLPFFQGEGRGGVSLLA
jgi:hypothetical protein